MHRRDKVELAVFCGLVLAGASVRLWLTDLPNFAPVAFASARRGWWNTLPSMRHPRTSVLSMACELQSVNSLSRISESAAPPSPLSASLPLQPMRLQRTRWFVPPLNSME